MELNKIAEIRSGHLNRGRIVSREDGSHFLIQARDTIADSLICDTNNLVRFKPNLSPSDRVLKIGDILFMARGSRNFALLLNDPPNSTLAAACFFVIRVTSSQVLPVYVAWYLNQAEVRDYLRRYSGRSVHMPIVRRAVLEKTEILIPSPETQRRIAELDFLEREEEMLLEKLSKNSKDLITAVCLRAAEADNKERTIK
jgi:hypothetical protein